MCVDIDVEVCAMINSIVCRLIMSDTRCARRCKTRLLRIMIGITNQNSNFMYLFSVINQVLFLAHCITYNIIIINFYTLK